MSHLLCAPVRRRSQLQTPLLAHDASKLEADVLVVGAGPVGLLTAIELTQRKVRVNIIDRWPKQEIKTKAIGVNKHSLSVLPTTVVKQIQEDACKPKCMRVHEVVGDERKTLVDLKGMDAPVKNEYLTLYCIEQWKTERMLEKYLNHLGVHVKRPVILRDFVDKPDFVECDLAPSEDASSERVKFGFVVGCDGGSSFVRKKLGFEFKGDVAKESFVSAHCKFENQVASADYGDVFLGKNAPGGNPLTAGMCISLPLHDGEHLINLDLDEAQQKKYTLDEVDSHGLPKLKELTLEDILDMYRARTACPDMTANPKDVTWIAHYRVNSRLAEHFGSGRVYLAGDACHCHSPVGGQGMNMGIQDAKNLSWKLAAVVKKSAHQSLLLTYEEERRGIDAIITKNVEKATTVFSNRNPLVFFLRGRPQRVIGATLNMLPTVAKTGRGWALDRSSLSYEHWERPSAFATFRDAIRNPTRIYRRRQNLYRWSGAVGARICAGDTVPPVLVDGVNLFDMIRSSPGWTLLLFEGDASANDEAFRNGLPVLSYSELQRLGEELKNAPDKDGYVGFIDKVAIFPSSDIVAHETFSVLGQCLFLVRPDTHVGLRSEPVRKGAVTRYLTSIGGMNVPVHQCPSGTTSFDSLPAALFATLVCIVTLVMYGKV